MEWLGQWIHKRYTESGGEIGFKRFKTSIRLTKTNIRKLREVLSPCSPDKTDNIGERVIDLVCDVWGMAGPDCLTVPA